jgi:hypothetical protein
MEQKMRGRHLPPRSHKQKITGRKRGIGWEDARTALRTEKAASASRAIAGRTQRTEGLWRSPGARLRRA